MRSRGGDSVVIKEVGEQGLRGGGIKGMLIIRNGDGGV
jgi:hypothetical protein